MDQIVFNQAVPSFPYSKAFTRAYTNFPVPAKTIGFDPERIHTAETWEHVLYSDLFTRLRFFFSTVSFHSNQDPHNVDLLKLAVQIGEDLLLTPQFAQYGFILDNDYYAGGVIMGQYHRHLKAHGVSGGLLEIYEEHMVALWTQYYCNTGDDNIGIYLKDQYNPYVGKPFTKPSKIHSDTYHRCVTQRKKQ
jgi:hypothetical protein